MPQHGESAGLCRRVPQAAVTLPLLGPSRTSCSAANDARLPLLPLLLVKAPAGRPSVLRRCRCSSRIRALPANTHRVARRRTSQMPWNWRAVTSGWLSQVCALSTAAQRAAAACSTVTSSTIQIDQRASIAGTERGSTGLRRRHRCSKRLSRHVGMLQIAWCIPTHTPSGCKATL